MLIKFLLNGKEINLTSDDTIIKSNNFNVDKYGNMSCSNADINGTVTSNNVNITGGKINLSANEGNIQIKVYNNRNSNSNTSIYPGSIGIYDESYTELPLIHLGIAQGDGNFGSIRLINNYNNGEETQIHSFGISTPYITQTSLKESKKNFEKLQNGLDIIKNTDIYKYNLKSQKDDDKKHIGFVIGENYKYSHEITALDSEKKEVGVDTYSMISVAYKAIQEQQEIIEKLQEKIKELEEK